MPVLKETMPCNVCGKNLVKYGSIVCSDCKGNSKKEHNRIFTKDTVFLVCKWYGEGMKISKTAKLLNRSEYNIKKALKQGGKG